MPMAIDQSDRRLLIGAGGIFLLLLCAIAFLTPSGQNDGVVSSSYSSNPNGTRAAYLLLQQLRFSVERWEDSPINLPQESLNTMLILADPTESPNARERDALLRYVQEGGRVLLTGALVEQFFSGAHLYSEPPDDATRTFPAIVPSGFTRRAPSVEFHPRALWKEIESTQIPLYGDAKHPVAVAWRIGNGYLLWWAGADPLTNTHIAEGHNLVLFLNTLETDENDTAPLKKVYWDEYFHGQRMSLWAYAKKTPVIWGMVQTILFAIAILLTLGRRAGPVVPFVAPARLWPLEFVDTLGELYARAGATPAAVDIVYRNLRSGLTRQLRLPLTTSDSALAQAVENRLGWRKAGLADTLERAKAARQDRNVTPANALALVQELEACERQFDLKQSGTPGRP
jgi:hypothetical protein